MNIYVGPCIIAKDLSYSAPVTVSFKACPNEACSAHGKQTENSAKFCSSCGTAVAEKTTESSPTRFVADYWMHHDYRQGFDESLAVMGDNTCLIPNKKNKRLNNHWASYRAVIIEFEGSFDIQKELDTFKEVYADEIAFIEKLCEKPVQVAWRVVID